MASETLRDREVTARLPWTLRNRRTTPKLTFRIREADAWQHEPIARSHLPAPAGPHSLLSATIGSTLVALRAGTYDANVVTKPKITATAMNVCGSSGVIPNSIP
jgi:hypothetical protein